MPRDHVLLRSLAVWGAASVAAGALLAWLWPGLVVAPTHGFDEVLVWGCDLAAVLGVGWLWVLTTVVATDAVRGRPERTRRGIPVAARRLVLGACGVALATSAAAAPSYAGDSRHDPGVRALVGLPVPDRTTALSVVAAAFVEARQPRHRRAPAPEAARSADRSVVVASGDSLWSIAAGTLPRSAADAVVADRCRRLYALNRNVIGPDPDLIRPGQRLRLPAVLEEDNSR